MIVSIFVIALLIGVRQTMKHSTDMFQLHFDWDKKELIYGKDHLKIDSLSYNYLSLSGADSTYQSNNQNTYSMTFPNGKVFFFRFISSESKDGKIEFKAVEWLTGIPDFSDAEVKLEELNVPFVQNNGYTILTLGDEFLVKDEAKYYRKKIASQMDVNFLGSQTDVFNFKHEATFHGDWNFIFKEIPKIDTAQVYIISAGIEEHELMQSELKSKLNQILNELATRNSTQKIIWINAPFVKNRSKNELNRAFNEILMNLDNEKLQILDAYSLFKNEKANYLMADSVHLNKFGYELLAKKTIELLQ